MSGLYSMSSVMEMAGVIIVLVLMVILFWIWSDL